MDYQHITSYWTNFKTTPYYINNFYWVTILSVFETMHPHYKSWINIQRKPVHSQRNPCSNHLVQCIICKVAIWTYNTKSHYEAVHQDVEYDDSQFVSVVERAEMKKLAAKLMK